MGARTRCFANCFATRIACIAALCIAPATALPQIARVALVASAFTRTAALPPLAKNLARGAALKCSADVAGGLPFEVWKSNVVLESRKARHERRDDLRVLADLVSARGVLALWAGLPARLADGLFSGAVLLAAKESIRALGFRAGLPATAVAFAAGACGGAAQAITMGPCALLVTRTTATGGTVAQTLRETLDRGGFLELYTGSGAIALRQATNWASRQGLTELVRPLCPAGRRGEVLAAIVGGCLSCWNTPFDIARIEAQCQAVEGEKPSNALRTLWDIASDPARGPGALFAGVVPRMGQASFQTVFLVCVPRLLGSR